MVQKDGVIHLDRYTRDARQAVAGAQRDADDGGHAEVTPLHLMRRLVQRDDVVSAFRRAGGDPSEARRLSEDALKGLPRRAAGVAYLEPRLVDLLGRAEREVTQHASKTVGVEHLLRALAQEIMGPASEILHAVGIAPGAFQAPAPPPDEDEVDALDQALDRDPDDLEAFERIHDILVSHEDWKGLERSYRRMLRRVAGEGKVELEHGLWHRLGMIYKDRLADAACAIEAIKMASRLAPRDIQEHEILGALYEADGQTDAALAAYRSVLDADARLVSPYLKIHRLQLEREAYDEAWCAAAAAAFLGEADEETQRFFEDHRPKGVPVVQGRLDDGQWTRNLMHGEDDLQVGRIFAALAPAARKAQIEILTEKNQLPVLPGQLRQDPVTSKVILARIFGWAAQVLGVPCPELYVRVDVPGMLTAVASEPPASVAGRTALTAFSPHELSFVIGEHLAMYRGEHCLEVLFPAAGELTVLLFAGVTLVAPTVPSPPALASPIAAAVRVLRPKVQPSELRALRIAVESFLAEGGKVDVRRWMRAVEITACRAGLLLCGDLEIARKVIAAEPPRPGDLAPEEKLAELLRFSVSERYHALRVALGVALAAPTHAGARTPPSPRGRSAP